MVTKFTGCPRRQHRTTCSTGKAARKPAPVDAEIAPAPGPRVQASVNHNNFLRIAVICAFVAILIRAQERRVLTAELDRLREREVNHIQNYQHLKRQFQMQAQEKMKLKTEIGDLWQKNDYLRMEEQNVTANLQEVKHFSIQRIGQLHKEKMKLKMENGDIWQKNDYLRMEVQNVTANLQEVTHFSIQRIGQLRKEKMKLTRQNGDLWQRNDYLHMEVQNLTATLQEVKQFIGEQINEYIQELDQLRGDHAEQLALVHQQSVGRIEERDERIHQLEVDFKRTNEKVLDLQVELHRTLSELDQCKTSQEAWNTAAKAAGGVAIVLASALAFPYAAPFVGAAVKTVFL